jgi:signal transduction histidine kinase
MPWTSAYTPAIWVPLATIPCLLALFAYCCHRRDVPGAVPLAIASLFALLWVISDIMKVIAVDVTQEVVWHKLQVGATLPALSGMFCFALEYTWPRRWTGRRTLLLLSIAPLLLWITLATDGVTHLMWRNITLHGQFYPQLAPLGWAFLAYAYALYLIELAVYIWLFRRSPQHRWPVAIIMGGSVLTRTLYLVSVAHWITLGRIGDVPIIPFALSVHLIALFGFRVFDPLPLARRRAIEQLPGGMLVLDQQERVASLNPAAEWMLGTTLKEAKGRAVQELLPAYPEGPLVDPGETVVEYSTADTLGPSARPVRHYVLAVSLLKDWRGMDAGRLLILRDATNEREAEAQIVRQQRSLAMLQEREQLARELHDSTGQVLAYTGYQLDAVSAQIMEGQAALAAGHARGAAAHMAEAEKQVARLSRIIEEAHADLRGEILNLRVTPSDEQPLFATLHRYLDGYCQNYAIQTQLTVAPGLETSKFEPEAQQHLFRIVQEGLSNARKHGKAGTVQVSFEAEGRLARLLIEDNGCGFDPQQTPASGESHLGLRSMRERAEQLGASLHVESAPGAGTRVIVELPVKQ